MSAVTPGELEQTHDPEAMDSASSVFLCLGIDSTAWFSWEEWSDLVRRIEHSIAWIETNSPDD